MASYKYYKKQRSTDNWWYGWVIFFRVCCGIIIIIFFIIQFNSHSAQINSFENLRKIDALETVYKNKAESLTTQFANYLHTSYPEYEKDIFDKIKPDEVDLYLVKYPDLKASETITTLVAEIKDLQADYYQQKVDRVNVQKDIRFRKRNPWIFGALIPSPPEDLM
ncbi:hypothetical protein ACFL1Y_01645 [Patescibacteria group bacterium]